MRKLDNRKKMGLRRPKKVDVDKPTGFVKKFLRRKWRLILNRINK
jgi:hypothetical protein